MKLSREKAVHNKLVKLAPGNNFIIDFQSEKRIKLVKYSSRLKYQRITITDLVQADWKISDIRHGQDNYKTNLTFS